MITTLAQVLPLNIASIISPCLFAAALIILSGRKDPVLRAFLLFLGTLSLSLVTVTIGALLGNPSPEKHHEILIAIAINFFLGALFLFFAIRVHFTKERRINKRKLEQRKYWHIFIFGILINVTNLDAVVLSLAAAKEAFEAPAIGETAKLILLAINVAFFTLPIWLPLAFYLVAPKTAIPALEKFNIYLEKYGQIIMFIVFLVMGCWFFYQGIDLVINRWPW